MIQANENLTRQLDIIPISILGERITIIGAGAIGGWVTLSLAKMGFQDITVYDHDKVDVVNMNSQFYRYKDIGNFKVKALAELVGEFTNVNIDAHAYKYESGIFPGIVISAVDSMAVRRLIWEKHKNKSPFTRAIIDPRMGAENALLYVMKPMVAKDIVSYEKTLYSDDDAVREPCTAKATVYCANMLSGLVVKTVKDLLTKPNYLRAAQWDIAGNVFTCGEAKSI